MIKRLLSIIWCCVATLGLGGEVAMAQGVDTARFTPKVRAWLSPDSVAIGDVLELVIEVDKDVMQSVAFPDIDFSDSTQSQLLELVGEPIYDTVAAEGREMTLRRSYRLRSFDAGLYDMGRASVLVADRNVVDTLYSSDELKLQVTTFLIDSTSHAIFDLKPVLDLPFKFGEVSGYVGWSIFALIMLALVAYVVLRLMAHYGRPVMGLFGDLPPLPPHVEAFNELDRLYDERLWQVGEYKSYYSRLTDILRNYIMRRYGVSAISMSTDQIITAMRELELPKRCEMDMQSLLRDADLVKFAKAEISASENESYFEMSRNFVEQTRELTDEELAEQQAEDNQTREEEQL